MLPFLFPEARKADSSSREQRRLEQTDSGNFHELRRRAPVSKGVLHQRMVKSPSEVHKGQSTGVDGHEEMNTCLILTPLNMTFLWGHKKWSISICTNFLLLKYKQPIFQAHPLPPILLQPQAAYAGLELLLWLQMTLNSWSSCFYLSGAGL